MRKLVAAGAGMLALVAFPAPAAAATRHVWIAAVPTIWNVVPNERNAIEGERYTVDKTTMRTVVYERFTRSWKRKLPAQTRIPGPLIKARVGDDVFVHFKNKDTRFQRPHSMHFHGVHYPFGSDGSFIPGFSGAGADVMPGKSFTYQLHAGADSAGVWPYHDHSPSMMDSIAGGMYGMLSIRGRREALPDKEFVVVFAAMGDFQTIDGRAFVGNTPVFTAFPGQLVQWDVMAMGSEHHTFHVHGHRWITPGGISRDTQTVGPAESFRFRWREQDPGTWLYHCHVEDHMMRGMIGIYRVDR